MFVTSIKDVPAVALVVGLALGGIGVGLGLATNPAVGQQLVPGADGAKKPDNKGKDAGLQFEQVVWVRNKAPQASVLYVLVPEVAKDLDEVAKLVLRYAPAALREVDELAGTDALKRARLTDRLGVAFVVRQGKADKQPVMTGFSLDQLQEYTKASEARALQLIRRHAWTFQKLPLINQGP